MSLTTKVTWQNFSLLNEKSYYYNKTVIDFNFGRHGFIYPYVYLIEVNNCIIFLRCFIGFIFCWKFSSIFVRTGPRSPVGNVSGYRCVSDCNSRGREFDPGPVPYFRGD